MSDIKVTLTKEEKVAVPDTGAFTFLKSTNQNDNSKSTDNIMQNAVPIISLVFIATILVMMIGRRIRKTYNHNLKKEFRINSRAKSIRSIIGISVVLLVAIISIISNNKKNDELAFATVENSLTLTASSISIDAELTGKDTALAVPGKIIINSPTQAGYVLSVYSDKADLVASSETITTKISGLEVSDEPTTLSSNTWGIAMTKPTDSASEVWYAVPTSQSSARIIKDTSASTLADDETTIYYGVNVNDKLESGEYTGVINYVAIANVIPDQKIYLQDYSVDQCEAQATNQSVIVYDRRDMTQYHVQRLADGNCWLLDNLALDLVQTPLVTLSGNTNASDETLQYLKGERTGTLQSKYPTSQVAYGGEQLSYTVPLISVADKDVVSAGGYNDFSRGYYKLGVRYNYCAVTAGSYCYASDSAPSSSVSPTEDICPKNWRLPTFSELSGVSDDRLPLSLPNDGDWATSTRSNWCLDGPCYGIASMAYYNGVIFGCRPGDDVGSCNKNCNYLYNIRCLLKEQAEPVNYTIYYNANGGSGAMTATMATVGNNVQLKRNTFTRSGFTFNGWNTEPDGSGTWYGQGGAEPIYITLTSLPPNNAITLYAQWKQEGGASTEKIYMQDMAISDCPIGGTSVYDKRDEQEYSVARIGDSCWMTKNLNLAGGTSLYSDTSNVPSGYSSSSQTPYFILPAGVTDAGGEDDFSSDEVAYVSNNASKTCGENSPCYSYYSWVAATAGNLTNTSSDGDSAPYSICPSGWHLPSTSEQNVINYSDFRNLMVALGGDSTTFIYYDETNPTGTEISDKLTSSPNNFVKGGMYCRVKASDGILAASCPIRGALAGGGGTGGYWSSTRAESDGAYAFFFNSYVVNSAYTPLARTGLSVRCVMDNQ